MCKAPSVEQCAGGQVAPLLSVVNTKHTFTNNNNSKLVDIVCGCNNARMNKFNFTTEKIVQCRLHMTMFEIVVYRIVDNWIQLLT